MAIRVETKGGGTATPREGEEVPFRLSNHWPLSRLWCLETEPKVLAFLWEEGGSDISVAAVEVIDRRTGKTRWFTVIETFQVGNPLLLEDAIVVAGSTSVAKIELQHGAVVWRHIQYDKVLGEADRPRLDVDRVEVSYPGTGARLLLDLRTGRPLPGDDPGRK